MSDHGLAAYRTAAEQWKAEDKAYRLTYHAIRTRYYHALVYWMGNRPLQLRYHSRLSVWLHDFWMASGPLLMDVQPYQPEHVPDGVMEYAYHEALMQAIEVRRKSDATEAPAMGTAVPDR